jgi:restriction endonuclease S subunit
MSWKKVKIKDILKQYRVQHIVQDSIEYKQVSILNDGSVVLRGKKIGKDIGRKRQFKIDLETYPNTLIFTRQLLLQGSIGIASSDVDDCIVTENMPMFSVQTSIIDKDFLIFFLKSEVFKSRIRLIELSGSAQKSIHEKTFLNLEFVIPSIEEQKNLVIELTKLKNSGLAISSELIYQLNLIKQLRQSFLREAMQGKLVTSVTLSAVETQQTGQQLLAKIKAEKAQLIAEKKLKKEKPLPPFTDLEIPFEIPKHWAWCRLGEIAYITSGSTPSKESFVENGIPYLKMYNLRNQKIDFFYKPQYIKEEVHNGQLKRCRAYSGDVIMNIVGPPLGKIAIIPETIPECNFNQAAVLIRPLLKNMNYFIFWHLNEMSEIKSIDTKGVAGQANISVTQSHNIKIPLPPLHEQEQIVAKLEELMKFCEDLEQSIKESQSFNEMLLQQVLREALQGEKKK